MVFNLYFLSFYEIFRMNSQFNYKSLKALDRYDFSLQKFSAIDYNSNLAIIMSFVKESSVSSFGNTTILNQ